MLKQQRSLKVDFAVWIAVAFLICCAVPMLAKASLCNPSPQHEGTINRNASIDQTKQGSGNTRDSSVPQQISTEKQKEVAESANSKYLEMSGFCQETKPTDLALLFFTACLVIVGWFTIVGGERNSKDMERAYIFGTPQIDRIKTNPGGPIFVEVMLFNYGRTPGTVEIIYGEGALTEPFGAPAYRNGSARVAGGMLPPTGIQPLRAPVTFECPVQNDFYFSGYIQYSDLFRRTHISRFTAKIFLDQSGIEAPGPQAFHDWN